MSYVKPQGLKLRDVSIVDWTIILKYDRVVIIFLRQVHKKCPGVPYLCDVNILTVLKIEQDNMAWYHALLNQYFNQSTL